MCVEPVCNVCSGVWTSVALTHACTVRAALFVRLLSAPPHGLMCLIYLLCSMSQILQAHGVRQLPNCVRQRVWSVGQLGHRHAAGTGFDRRHRRVLGARRECRQSLVVVHAMMSEGDRGRWMLMWLLCWCLRPCVASVPCGRDLGSLWVATSGSWARPRWTSGTLWQ